MSTVITVGSRYVIDETYGLQTDGEDDDVLVSSLPTVFSTYLFTTLGLSNAFAIANGAAHSSTNVITVSSSTPITELTLNDANNGTLDGDYTNLLTLDGNNIFLYATSDPHIVLGREGTGDTANASGDVVFAIYLDANATNTSATLWTVQFEAIKHPDGTSVDEVVDLGNYLKVGAVADWSVNLGTLKAGQLLFGSFGDPDNGNAADDEIAVIVIAKDQSTSDGDGKDTVNTSKAAGAVTIGVSNQMFDAGDGAYFTYVTGMTGTVDNKGDTTLPSAGANDPNGANLIQYGDLSSSVGASFTIVQIQAGGNNPETNVRISAFVTAKETGANFITGLTNDTQVKIDPNSVQVFLGGNEITDFVVTEVGLGVDVSGVPEGATVRYLTVDGNGDPTQHNRTLIENVNGSPFDIGGFALVGPPAFESIGQAIGFGDDGPVAQVALTANLAITDESTGANASDGGLAAADDESGHTAVIVGGATLIGYDQAQLVSASGSSAGTDGGSTVLSLRLASSTSGLQTTDGTAITLVQAVPGGSIVGWAGGVAVFGIALDQSGNVTVEQYGSIRHSPVGTYDNVAYLATNSIYAVVTVTDGDTDVRSHEVSLAGRIGFEDDGPSVTLALNAVTIVIDESVGADAGDLVGTPASSNAAANDEAGQAAGVIGYAQVAGATLFTTSADVGEDNENATVVYKLNVDVAATSLKVSDTSLSSANAAITLVEINDQTVEGQYNSGALAFRITIDATTGTVAVTQFEALFHPDNTKSDEAVSLGSGLLSAIRVATDGDLDVATSLGVDIGGIISIEDDGPKIADGAKTDLWIENVVNDTDSGSFLLDGGSDQPDSFNIVGAPVGNGLTFAYADVDGDGVIGQNEIIGKLNGTNFYSLLVNSDGTYDFKLLSAVPGSSTDLDLQDIKAGGPNTNFISIGTLSSSDYVKISGYYDADGAGGNPRAPAAVNESHFNVGVVNGNLDANETLSFSLYNSLNEIQDISGISIGTKTAKETQYTYTAYDDGVAVTGMINVPVTVGKNGTINIDAPSGVFFDTIDIVSVDGSAVKIGLGDIEIRRLPPDYQLDFDLALTDSDGDSVGASFIVQIDGNGDGSITDPVTDSLAPLQFQSDLGAFELSGSDGLLLV